MTSILFALAAGLTFGLMGPVTEVSIRPTPSATTEIVIAVAGEVEYREFTMEGPNRLVLDLFLKSAHEVEYLALILQPLATLGRYSP